MILNSNFDNIIYDTYFFFVPNRLESYFIDDNEVMDNA